MPYGHDCVTTVARARREPDATRIHLYRESMGNTEVRDEPTDYWWPNEGEGVRPRAGWC